MFLASSFDSARGTKVLLDDEKKPNNPEFQNLDTTKGFDEAGCWVATS